MWNYLLEKYNIGNTAQCLPFQICRLSQWPMSTPTRPTGSPRHPCRAHQQTPLRVFLFRSRSGSPDSRGTLAPASWIFLWINELLNEECLKQPQPFASAPEMCVLVIIAVLYRRTQNTKSMSRKARWASHRKLSSPGWAKGRP